MELVYAGLHQLLTPMLDRLERLPAPQANALRTAFGLSSGSVPDRFLVGLATLSLLAEMAEEHPLVCLVDDAQWLDRASAQILAFAARRLEAESVGLVFGARVPGDELAGLPELVLEGLQEADARALLDSVLTGPLDPRVHDRIVAEAGGNPLALLELPRGVTPAKLAGGFALPDATAWRAANMAGQGDVALEICRAIRALPQVPGSPRPLDTLLEAVAMLTIDGRAAATPVLQQAAKALAEIPMEDVIRWGSPAAATAASWDVEGWRALNERHVQLVRDAGALAQLPLRLVALGIATAWVGDFAGAASAIAESESVAAATGSRIAPYALLRLRALQGWEVETSALIVAALEQGGAGGQGMVAIHAHWAAAVLYNGLARYEQAASAARQATSNTFEPWVSMWGLPELIEAATRAGDAELAQEALRRLEETTQPSGVDVALGIEARCRALLSDGATAEELYREAIERLGHTEVRPELARAHLLYGEWLRREGRRVDAREQLRTANDLFDAIGMEAFAKRARRELRATGETARKRTIETHDALTAQEALIARLAREGLSNPEIGVRLFISARTVKYHLGKVFTKLDISSRGQLDRVLPSDPAAPRRFQL
jgi:DNA-binding CsgD family transcriptional regulator